MNEYIINKAIQMYFNGEDWQGYIKQEVKRRRSLEDDFRRMFRNWDRSLT